MVSIYTCFILATLLVVASAQFCLYSDGVTTSGEIENGFCNCYSGYYSSQNDLSNCVAKAPSNCAFNAAPTQLSTDYVPILDEAASKVVENNLILVVRSPLVHSRLRTTLSLQGGNPYFAYPSEYWQKYVEDCNDTFIFKMPLKSALSAGFDRSEDDTYYYLSGVLVVVYYDQIGELRGQPITRTTQSILRIEIRFPKKITVTSDVYAVSDRSLSAAITYQGYDPETNRGVIEFVTAVPFPLKVAAIDDIASPDPITSAATDISKVSCGSGTNSDCVQKFRMYINPNGACRLNGEYTLTVSFDCRNLQCPKLGFGFIVATLQSEDFCNVIRLDIDLTGSMSVFKDSSMAQLSQSFVPSEFPFFVASVDSTRALIQSSSIIEVFYKLPDGSSQTLYTDSSVTPLGEANYFNTTNLDANTNSFSVKLTVGNGGFNLLSLENLDPTLTTPISNVIAPSTQEPETPAAQTTIDPILECVEQVDDQTFIAYFGYNNPGLTVRIPVGSENNFNSTGVFNDNMGQAVRFTPHRTQYYPMALFSITWDGTNDLVWSLNGVNRTASASDLSVRCPSTLQFEISLNWTNPLTQPEYVNFRNALATSMELKQEQLILNGATVLNTVTTYTFRIIENLNVSDVTAKEALLTLLDMRSNATQMQLIVDPLKQNLGIQFAGISMMPTGVEVQSDSESNSAIPAKRSTVVSLFENNKRYVNRDSVSGQVQFYAVVEVTWQSIPVQKKRFAMNLMQAAVTGRQSKKFSSGINIDATSVLQQPIGFGQRTGDTRSQNRIDVHSLMFLASLLGCLLLVF